jgi:hypothetical protein
MYIILKIKVEKQTDTQFCLLKIIKMTINNLSLPILTLLEMPISI